MIRKVDVDFRVERLTKNGWTENFGNGLLCIYSSPDNALTAKKSMEEIYPGHRIQAVKVTTTTEVEVLD